MTQKSILETEEGRYDFLLIAIQETDSRHVEQANLFESRLAKLEAKICDYETVDKEYVLKSLSISARTFYRKLKSGEIIERMKGRYAISEALYSTIKPVDYSSMSLEEIVEIGNKYVEKKHIPSYVFTTSL